jgi:hypothetical protein
MVQPHGRPAAANNGADIVSGIDSVPVTKERRPPQNLDSKVTQPGEPRGFDMWLAAGMPCQRASGSYVA